MRNVASAQYLAQQWGGYQEATISSVQSRSVAPLKLLLGALRVVSGAAERMLLPQKLLVLVVQAPLYDGDSLKEALLVGRTAIAIRLPRFLFGWIRCKRGIQWRVTTITEKGGEAAH